MDPIESFNLVEGVNLDDTSFSKEEILAAQAIIRQYVSDRYKDLDLSELASLHDLVVRPLAQVFLVVKKLIEPPDGKLVREALVKLVQWGALGPAPTFDVLDLGRISLLMPVDVSLTKMILTGAATGCARSSPNRR